MSSSNKGFDSTYKEAHSTRFSRTFNFFSNVVSGEEKILDLGPSNPFSAFLREQGYQVENTPESVDLDLNPEVIANYQYEVLTAFEIFEHLVSPFPLLRESKATKLVASVPLKLWFANAYWSEKDPFDRHYHEFEPRQFDMLLEKAGWKVIQSEKWKNISPQIGIRPILRRFTPRHYIVYCERQ